MKRNVFSILLSLTIFSFILIDSIFFPYSKNILVGIWFVFPMIFIIQGLISSRSIKGFILGLSMSIIALNLPIFLWYKIGDMRYVTLVYIILGIISFKLTRKGIN